MSNNSATGGYLDPAASPAPLEDEAFENFLHDIFVGLTGMPGADIRPRWQPEPANQPVLEGDWMAFGIQRMEADDYAYIQHLPGVNGEEPAGLDRLQRHETVDVLISSYGANASRNLALLRDSVLIEQNRDALTAAGMGFLKSSDIIPAPTLVKDRWLRRYDMTFSLRRAIWRDYPVLNLLSGHSVLRAQRMNSAHEIVTPINVTEPA